MNMHAIALPLTVADIIDEYAEKVSNIESNIAEFKAAHDRMSMATTVRGVYVERVINDVYLSERAIALNLRKSGWKAVYQRLQIDALASANDKRLFEQTLADPPELTLDNAKATFGDYLVRPRFHQLRALAECFVSLDAAYKSHSKVKIGVAGLPKRIILLSFRGYGSWGRDRFRDVLNALAGVSGLPQISHEELKEVEQFCGPFGNKRGNAHLRGVEVRIFENGNAHVIFEPGTLRTINLALAEFYGDVLPDVETDDASVCSTASTKPAKDLQFYPTPRQVIEKVLYETGLHKLDNRYGRVEQPKRVLEPSCGDGRMMTAIAERGHRVFGIEIHPGRAAEAVRNGCRAMCANFLETAPNPIYDAVVMNPPFYGEHWRKHLAHARKFLAPGGVLACILPATAEYDHGIAKGTGGEWCDLPVASFAESGTNIPTGFLILHGERT